MHDVEADAAALASVPKKLRAGWAKHEAGWATERYTAASARAEARDHEHAKAEHDRKDVEKAAREALAAEKRLRKPNGAHGVNVAVPTQPRVDDSDAWRMRLIPNRRTGQALAIPANVATMFRYHRDWLGIIAYDAFAEATVTLKPPPWHPVDAPAEVLSGEWTDADTQRAVNWLARFEGLNVVAKSVEAALSVVSAARIVHPVKEYLESLTWDGTERLGALLPVYFATLDNAYTRGVGRRWMISCVARIYQAGCQADCTLILESRKQGTGKTSAFRSLVPKPGWYQDSGIDLSNKDSFIALRCVWIYGLDELDSLRKGDITRWKNFLSQTCDHYRPPYARRTRDFARQNIFCGTTNDEEYLVDRTGNRRFWPVALAPDGEIDPAKIVVDRDQLWAEAVHRYRAGEHWHVDTPEFRAMCEAEQHDRVHKDPWLSTIAKWLGKPSSIIEYDDENGLKRTTIGQYDASRGVLTEDVLAYALGMKRDRIKKVDSQRVAESLKELGYQRGPQVTEGGARVRRYVPAPTSTDPSAEVGAK